MEVQCVRLEGDILDISDRTYSESDSSENGNEHCIDSGLSESHDCEDGDLDECVEPQILDSYVEPQELDGCVEPQELDQYVVTQESMSFEVEDEVKVDPDSNAIDNSNVLSDSTSKIINNAEGASNLASGISDRSEEDIDSTGNLNVTDEEVNKSGASIDWNGVQSDDGLDSDAESQCASLGFDVGDESSGYPVNSENQKHGKKDQIGKTNGSGKIIEFSHTEKSPENHSSIIHHDKIPQEVTKDKVRTRNDNRPFKIVESKVETPGKIDKGLALMLKMAMKALERGDLTTSGKHGKLPIYDMVKNEDLQNIFNNASHADREGSGMKGEQPKADNDVSIKDPVVHYEEKKNDDSREEVIVHESVLHGSHTEVEIEDSQADEEIHDESGADVEVDESQGDVEVDESRADVDVDESGADVEVDKSPADVEVYKSCAVVEVDEFRADLEVEESGADVEVDESRADVEFDESTADVEVNESRADVEVDESGANMEVYKSCAVVEVDESHADVEVDESRGDVEVNESGADVEVDESRADVEVDKSRADVEVDESCADVEVYESRADVEVDESGADVEVDEFRADVEVDESQADVVVNECCADVEVDKFQANVEVNKSGFDVEVDESGADVEVNESRADVVVDESGADVKVDESQADVEVDESQADVEVNESPADVEVNESRVEIEVNESGADVEVDKSRADVEVDESRADVEVDESRVEIEVNESRADVEVEESGADVEVDESQADVEVDESRADVEVDESRIENDHGKSADLESYKSQIEEEYNESNTESKPAESFVDESHVVGKQNEWLAEVELEKTEPDESQPFVGPDESQDSEPDESQPYVGPDESREENEPDESQPYIEPDETRAEVAPTESYADVEPIESREDLEPGKSYAESKPHESQARVERETSHVVKDNFEPALSYEASSTTYSPGGGNYDVDNIADDADNMADDAHNTTDDAVNKAVDVHNTADDANDMTDEVDNVADDADNMADNADNMAVDVHYMTDDADNMAVDVNNTADDANDMTDDADNMANDDDNMADDADNMADHVDRNEFAMTTIANAEMYDHESEAETGYFSQAYKMTEEEFEVDYKDQDDAASNIRSAVVTSNITNNDDANSCVITSNIVDYDGSYHGDEQPHITLRKGTRNSKSSTSFRGTLQRIDNYDAESDYFDYMKQDDENKELYNRDKDHASILERPAHDNLSFVSESQKIDMLSEYRSTHGNSNGNEDVFNLLPNFGNSALNYPAIDGGNEDTNPDYEVTNKDYKITNKDHEVINKDYEVTNKDYEVTHDHVDRRTRMLYPGVALDDNTDNERLSKQFGNNCNNFDDRETEEDNFNGCEDSVAPHEVDKFSHVENDQHQHNFHVEPGLCNCNSDVGHGLAQQDFEVGDGLPQQNFDGEDDLPQQDFDAEDDGLPQQDFNAEEDGLPQQDFNAEDDGLHQQDFDAEDGLPPQDFNAEDDGLPQQDFDAEDGLPPQDFDAEHDSLHQQNFGAQVTQIQNEMPEIENFTPGPVYEAIDDEFVNDTEVVNGRFEVGYDNIEDPGDTSNYHEEYTNAEELNADDLSDPVYGTPRELSDQNHGYSEIDNNTGLTSHHYEMTDEWRDRIIEDEIDVSHIQIRTGFEDKNELDEGNISTSYQPSHHDDAQIDRSDVSMDYHSSSSDKSVKFLPDANHDDILYSKTVDGDDENLKNDCDRARDENNNINEQKNRFNQLNCDEIISKDSHSGVINEFNNSNDDEYQRSPSGTRKFSSAGLLQSLDSISTSSLSAVDKLRNGNPKKQSEKSKNSFSFRLSKKNTVGRTGTMVRSLSAPIGLLERNKFIPTTQLNILPENESSENLFYKKSSNPIYLSDSDSESSFYDY